MGDEGHGRDARASQQRGAVVAARCTNPRAMEEGAGAAVWRP
nr:MAG TPA: hypothetical protein [Caudoviricetes sp.]